MTSVYFWTKVLCELTRRWTWAVTESFPISPGHSSHPPSLIILWYLCRVDAVKYHYAAAETEKAESCLCHTFFCLCICLVFVFWGLQNASACKNEGATSCRVLSSFFILTLSLHWSSLKPPTGMAKKKKKKKPLRSGSADSAECSVINWITLVSRLLNQFFSVLQSCKIIVSLAVISIWKVKKIPKLKLHVRLILSITSADHAASTESGRTVRFNSVLSSSDESLHDLQLLSYCKQMDVHTFSYSYIYIYIYILQVTVKITTKREPPEPRFQKLVTGL